MPRLSLITKLLTGFCLLLAGSVLAQAPTANFNYTLLTKPCGHVHVLFNATISTGNPTTYTWTGINVAGNNPVPTGHLIGPGSHPVTLTVSNANGQSQITKTIIVHDTPKVNFVGTPTTVCPNMPVIFLPTGTQLGAPGAATYTWIGAPGAFTGTPGTTMTFPPGLQDITLQVTNSNGCTSSLKKTAYINVFPQIQADFTSQTIFCDAPTPPVIFTAQPTGPGYTYNWDLGQQPGQIQAGNPVSKIYGPPKGATYPVTLVVTDGNGCKDTVYKPGHIKIHNLQANFTGPTSACIGTPVTFTSTTTPGNSICDWNYGAGETDDLGVQPSVTHTFVTSGTKTVRLITTLDGCKDTAYKTIVIHPKPTINFTNSPNPPCPAPSTITLTATGASSIFWDFGDGSPVQGPATTISHTYNPCGLYSPTIFATDANGCKDTLTKSQQVKVYCGDFDIKIPQPYVKDTCAPHTVKFNTESMAWWQLPSPGSQSPYPVPVTNYDWNFGLPGATSTAASPSYTYMNPGVYKVTLKVTTANGCIFYDTLDVFIGSKPIASFVVDTVVCAGQPLLFVNTTTIPGYNGGYIWDNWYFGDKTGTMNPGISNTVHYYDTAGTFCARLIVNYNNCLDTFDKCNIRVDSPVAKFTFNLNCTNRLNVTFKNHSYGYTSHQWYFGDGGTSTAIDPAYTYPSYGKYKVMLVTFNTASGCSDTATDDIELMDPDPVLTASDTTVCKNDSVRFNAIFVNPVSSSSLYNWYVNNVFMTKDSAVNYKHHFAQEGYYKVKVIMRDGMGCLDSVVKNNWVLVSKPAPDFTGTPPIGCVPHTVSFTDISTQVPAAAPSLPGAPIVTRKWEFASPLPGATTTNSTITYTYYTVGVYDVKLIVTDASGCKDSVLKPAYITSHKPKADFAVDDVTACVGQGLTFTNNTPTAVSAKWYFGDGDSSLVLSPTHVYKQPGSYTVTMIATDGYGCKDTMVKPAHVAVTRPTAGIFIKDTVSICPPLIIKCDTLGTRNAVKFLWSFQTSNNHPAQPKAVESFFFPGKYWVSLVVYDNFGCTDTAYRNVHLLGYDGAFDYTPLAGCAPLEVDFNLKLKNIPSLIWDFNDGNTMVTANTTVKHVYTVAGAYLPRVIMADTGGCSAASLGKDTIKVDDVFAGFTHTPLCEGYKVTFLDTSRGVFSQPNAWHWTFHTGLVYTIPNPSHYYAKPGKYPVKFIVTNANGCKDTLEKDIEINKLPVISAGADTIVCLNDAAQLLGTGGISYVWSPGNTLNCTNCPNPLATPRVPSDYTVIGTDANGCSDTDRVFVSLKYKVTSITGEGGQICEGEYLQLKVSGAHRYEWSPADLLDNNKSAEPTASPQKSTIFKVVAFEGSCIPDTDFVNVVVHPKPTVKAYGSATIVAGNDAPLNAEGDLIRSFLWKPTETLNCSDCPNPIAKPIATTKYVVIATSAYGCQDSDIVVVRVQCDKSQLFIPNTFTPNGDGQNDVFYPRGVGFSQLRSFRVFNRWGEIVYERRNFPMNDKSYGWDGNFRGQQLPPDVFMYTVEADCENNEVMLWKGDVTLIR